ncbi:MBL fold metallo-hydrolase [Alphaproteobacteria bacterium]|nr:MBL fold metallo-hydrolase [Alphaproteobacteria bacterium]
MEETMTPLDIDPPAAGQMTALAEDLYWIRFTLPFRLNHINLYALDTEAGWLLLDCGINTDSNAEQWPPMLDGPLAGKPIAGIIVSHHHADHVGYAGTLAALTGAPIYMGAIEHDMATMMLGHSAAAASDRAGNAYANFGLDADFVARAYDGGNYYRTLVGDLPPVTIVPAGHEFKTKHGSFAVRFDAGHSPGHMSLSDHARQIYIGVDFLLPRISPNISVGYGDLDEDVLANYLTYLQGMSDMGADWLIVPGHDWPYYGGGIRARQLIAHHEKRLNRLVETGQPLSTATAMVALFPFELTDHEVYFASCEARAHLNHLVTCGIMERTLVDGVAIFNPVP